MDSIIFSESMMSVSDSIDDLNVSTAAFGYYLYRQAGCPFGDTLSGFTAWVDIQKRAWYKLTDPSDEDI
jgi:hypothetical protein